VVLQAFAVPQPSWRYPTPEELRAVTYLSLAAGTKGVFYFIYQYMPDYLWGMKDPLTGEEQPIWATATALAGELGRLAPLLLSATLGEPVTVEGDARVGSLVAQDGRRVLVVASTSPGVPATARLHGVPSRLWADVLSGEPFEAGGDGVLSVLLAPGAGWVLVGQ
jgi:hypothetical protein